MPPPKASWGGKGLFHLTTYSPSLREVRAGTQGRNLEAGAKAESVEEHCFPAWIPWLAQFAFLSNPRSTTQGWHGPQWAWPCHTNQWARKCSIDLPVGQSDGDIFSAEVPFFPNDSGSCHIHKELTSGHFYLTFRELSVYFISSFID